MAGMKLMTKNNGDCCCEEEDDDPATCAEWAVGDYEVSVEIDAHSLWSCSGGCDAGDIPFSMVITGTFNGTSPDFAEDVVVELGCLSPGGLDQEAFLYVEFRCTATFGYNLRVTQGVMASGSAPASLGWQSLVDYEDFNDGQEIELSPIYNASDGPAFPFNPSCTHGQSISNYIPAVTPPNARVTIVKL